MYKNIIHWRWIPRYYRKSTATPTDTGVVYWYFGLETIFIMVMGLVIYCTTIKDASIRKAEVDSQVETLRKSISSQFREVNTSKEGEKTNSP